MRCFLIVATCLTVLVGGMGWAQATAYAITPIGQISPPGSGVSTTLTGINDAAQITGVQTTFYAHGPIGESLSSFLYNAGTYTAIYATPPYAYLGVGTFVSGLNNLGQVFGSVSGSDFIYFKGIFDYGLEEPILYYPGLIITNRPPGFSVIAINDSGVILADLKGSFLLYNNGDFTPIILPGTDPLLERNLLPSSFSKVNNVTTSISSSVNSLAINDAGRIVGSYTVVQNVTDVIDGVYGYKSTTYSTLDTDGVITPIVVPGSLTGSTQANGISSSGVIAGSYEDTTGATHGFLDDNGVYATVDVPGGTRTSLIGVNKAGDIIGTYDGQSFLGTPVAVPEPGSATLLGVGAALGLMARQRRARGTRT